MHSDWIVFSHQTSPNTYHFSSWYRAIKCRQHKPLANDFFAFKHDEMAIFCTKHGKTHQHCTQQRSASASEWLLVCSTTNNNFSPVSTYFLSIAAVSTVLFGIKILPFTLHSSIRFHLRHGFCPLKTIGMNTLNEVFKDERISSFAPIFRQNTNEK